jgi:hypothetical protein
MIHFRADDNMGTPTHPEPVEEIPSIWEWAAARILSAISETPLPLLNEGSRKRTSAPECPPEFARSIVRRFSGRDMVAESVTHLLDWNVRPGTGLQL